jgi:hypothetical protein
MKYGKLFRDYIEKYNHEPSTNRCSTLPYKELKQMAKNIYPDVKRSCDIFKDNNMLFEYMKMPHYQLSKAVYQALDYLYNY